MTDSIQCNLAQNALDYLLLAGEQAQVDTSRMLKHSVATLADGIELLLKARLEIYDWCLLFKNVDSADSEGYQTGDFQSVTMEQAANRLKNICGVSIKNQHIKVLEIIRKLRNKIRHFAIDTNSQEVISLLTKAYSFAIDFSTEHLESHYGSAVESELDSLRRLLGDFREFVDSRLKEIQPILAGQEYAWHIECPKCDQETLYPDGGHARCAFCGYEREGNKAAEELIDYRYRLFRPREKLERYQYIDNCPECGSEACIYDEIHECYICLSCGESGCYNRCTYCNCLFIEDPAPNGSCGGCWHDLLERND